MSERGFWQRSRTLCWPVIWVSGLKSSLYGACNGICQWHANSWKFRNINQLDLYILRYKLLWEFFNRAKHMASSVSARVRHVLWAGDKVLLRKRGQQSWFIVAAVEAFTAFERQRVEERRPVGDNGRQLRRRLPVYTDGLLTLTARVIAHSVSGGLFATH